MVNRLPAIYYQYFEMNYLFTFKILLPNDDVKCRT